MSEIEFRFSLKDRLNVGDTEYQTYGCRANNPGISKSCYIDNVCAFTSDDHICKSPSAKWKLYYKKLKADMNDD